MSDYDNKWISIHEPGGKFINKVGGSRLLGPKGVTVSNTGELIVVDNKASCVHVLQPSGKLVTKFGSRGSEMDQLAGPHYAAVNSLGNIIISDFHNHNIKVGLRYSKDHIYRMVIVEGCCTMARSSSFRSKLFIG